MFFSSSWSRWRIPACGFGGGEYARAAIGRRWDFAGFGRAGDRRQEAAAGAGQLRARDRRRGEPGRDAAAPVSRMTALATTREMLRIEGEFVYHVAPLEVPSRHQAALADALSTGGATVHHQNAGAAAGLLRRTARTFRRSGRYRMAFPCHRVCGRRAALLGVEQVAGRLDDRFALLTGGRRTALPRHQTLRATLTGAISCCLWWSRACCAA